MDYYSDQEYSPLLSSKETDDESASLDAISPWKWWHTAVVLCIRVIIDFAFKNPFFFYVNYEDEMGLDYFQFAAILIASEVGCMLAVFLKSSNVITVSEQTLMTVALIVCGVATICFPAFTVFFGEEYVIGTIVWCCCCRLIVGLNFALTSAASVKLASDYVESPEYVTQIISILLLSWPLANTLNVGSGYLMEAKSWEYVFLATGLALIAVAIISMVVFRRFSLSSDPDVDAEADQDAHDQQEMVPVPSAEALTTILSDWRSAIIILTSFVMTFRNRTIYIITASVWMTRTYDLSASEVGLTTLSTVLGELLGLSFMSVVSHRAALWISAVGTLTHQLTVGAVLFIIAAIYGNNVTLAGAMLFVVFITMGHESFYVVQQSNIIKYAPSDLRFMLLLTGRVAQEAGSILALVVAVMIWDKTGSNALLIFSVIWLCGVLLESFVLFIYKTDDATAVSQDVEE